MLREVLHFEKCSSHWVSHARGANQKPEKVTSRAGLLELLTIERQKSFTIFSPVTNLSSFLTGFINLPKLDGKMTLPKELNNSFAAKSAWC
jgi:hypothetical protein